MNPRRTSSALSLALPWLLLACNTASQGSPLPGTAELQARSASTPAVADQAVVDRLSAARCEREDGCKNVGPGAKFASHAVCLQQMRGSIGNALTTYACPKGLDGAAVDLCMTAIKGEECGHPVETIERLDRCRTDAMCMR